MHGHFEYKVRIHDAECGGAYGFTSRDAAIAHFKSTYPDWHDLACAVYAPGHRGCSYKTAGNSRFVHYADPTSGKYFSHWVARLTPYERSRISSDRIMEKLPPRPKEIINWF